MNLKGNTEINVLPFWFNIMDPNGNFFFLLMGWKLQHLQVLFQVKIKTNFTHTGECFPVSPFFYIWSTSEDPLLSKNIIEIYNQVTMQIPFELFSSQGMLKCWHISLRTNTHFSFECCFFPVGMLKKIQDSNAASYL